MFGFAQSVEQAASPLTAFLIGPIAHFIFIPYMTTGKGVELIGGWIGIGRGIALVFVVTGLIGMTATLIAMRGKSENHGQSATRKIYADIAIVALSSSLSITSQAIAIFASLQERWFRYSSGKTLFHPSRLFPMSGGKVTRRPLNSPGKI